MDSFGYDMLDVGAVGFPYSHGVALGLQVPIWEYVNYYLILEFITQWTVEYGSVEVLKSSIKGINSVVDLAMWLDYLIVWFEGDVGLTA